MKYYLIEGWFFYVLPRCLFAFSGAGLTKVEPFLVQSYEARYTRRYDFAVAKVMI